MRLSKKIISLFLLFSMAASILTVSSQASYGGGAGRPGSFWDASYESYESGSTAYNPGGIYGGGVSRGELAEKYDSFVSDLPATGFDSGGDLIIYPNNWVLIQDDTYFDYADFGPSSSLGACYFNGPLYKKPPKGETIGYVYCLLPFYDGLYELVPDYFTSFGSSRSFYFQGSVDGTEWNSICSATMGGSAFFSTYDSTKGYKFLRVCSNLIPQYSYSVGDSVSFKRGCHINFSSPDFSNSSYDISSRPTCLYFNYGIDGDDGTINNIGSQTIVNEAGDIFYNPVTNTSYDISDWTFDYSTRTYNITLVNDNSVTVEYADNSVNIVEGDTIYNIYYLVDEDTLQSGCVHSFNCEHTTLPSCILLGVDTYTCSLCGKSYTESVSAVGHTWSVKQNVQTQYNENGELVTEGYTLYECGVCGEQYKSTDGIPPSSGNNDSPGSSGETLSWLDKIYQKLCDILIAIGAIESPDINVEVEVVEGETQETQESWVSKFISKFNFLSSIGNIYKQLVDDVTSDAATAAAVADGAVLLNDVTGDHANTEIATVSYTAPELAISFGSSDKYGVDWVNIKPLNLSWYAPYKETVDGILSGILWLSYLFLLIKRAPGIIQGSEMVTEDRIKIDAWRSRH